MLINRITDKIIVKKGSILESIVKITFIPIALIFSRFAIYVLSVIGFLLSLVYLLLWFIFPKSVLCIFCRIGREGDKCKYCGEIIHKEQGVHPKNITSVFLNSFTILLLSFASLGVLYLENELLTNAEFIRAPKTVTFEATGKSQYKKGEIFVMGVDVVNSKTPINAVQMDISFDNDKLEVVNISTIDSFAEIFIQKEIDNEVGFVRVTGGMTSPGLISKKTNFATIVFKAKESGLAVVKFLDTSMVLANDGRGTNMLKSYDERYYLISEELIMTDQSAIEKRYLAEAHYETDPVNETYLNLFDENEDAEVLGIKDELRNEDNITDAVAEGPELESAHILENLGTSLYNFNHTVLKFWDGTLNRVFGAGDK
jgi:hypothetical protein